MGHVNSSERISFVCCVFVFFKRVLSEVRGLQIWQSFAVNGQVNEALK